MLNFVFTVSLGGYNGKSIIAQANICSFQSMSSMSMTTKSAKAGKVDPRYVAFGLKLSQISVALKISK